LSFLATVQSAKASQPSVGVPRESTIKSTSAVNFNSQFANLTCKYWFLLGCMFAPLLRC